jgi:predicted aspartyl protease
MAWIVKVGIDTLMVLGWLAGFWLLCVGIASLAMKRRLRHWGGLWLVGNILWIAAIWVIGMDDNTLRVLSIGLPFSRVVMTITDDLGNELGHLLAICGSLFLLAALVRYWAGRRQQTAAIPAQELGAEDAVHGKMRRKARGVGWVSAAILSGVVITLLANTRWHLWIVPAEKVIFHSQAPYQAVHIPFTLDGGQIIVHAILDGRSMACMIDTGTGSIYLPNHVRLNVAATGMVTTMRGFDGDEGQAQQVVLSRLRLGSYELQGTYGNIGTDGNTLDDLSANLPILGDDAFSHTVLTIDYARHELVMRQPQYDFTANGKSRHGFVMNFSQLADDPNAPCVKGIVQGKPLKVLLDTGYTDDNIGLDTATGQRVTSAHKSENLQRRGKVPSPSYLENRPLA